MGSVTVKRKIELMREPSPDFMELDVLESLPQDMPAPSVSNIRKGHRSAGEVDAWLSFSCPAYDPDGIHDPLAILRKLEASEFTAVTTTLVKWGNWRSQPWPDSSLYVPETHKREKLSDTWPMCPLWVSPCQFTEPSAKMFYRGPTGLKFKVSVDIPRISCRVTAHRVEFPGGWHFERGTAELRHPETWHHVYMGDESVAGLHAKRSAQVDTEQGVSGVIYWEPYLDPFPMSPADMLAYLLGSPTKTMDAGG